MSQEDEIKELTQKIEDLKTHIHDITTQNSDQQYLTNQSDQNTKVVIGLKQRRILKGHFGKIYACHWAQDSRHLVSASQDGKLIIWNGFTTNKVHAIPLRSSWVMTCAYSPSGGMVACGGLDNLCSVYKLPNGKDPVTSSGHMQGKTYAELAQHEGYLSCCRFIGDGEIITSSGDSTCILWDVELKTPKAIFNDHNGDVMSVSIFDRSGQFVSGSCDATAKIWDHRKNKQCVGTYHGHESDINSVSYCPEYGDVFATGSDDSSCLLFSTKAKRQINKYCDVKILCGITSVAFTKSGKALFAGYDDYNCYGWDTCKATLVDQLMGHENRVSSLGVSPDGKALCTGSWDTLLKIWA